jgi:hypothetical protein
VDDAVDPHEHGSSVFGTSFLSQSQVITLRNPIHADATLPDGRVVHVRVGVPEDSYVPARVRDTVDVEVFDDGEHLAAVSTVLGVDQVSAGRELLREIVEGLESGALAPTAGAIEPLADRLRE